ncbi:lamin tail domain-containing protein, partial [Patescibacteria group bacterium]|nr:lamin tail domain-containing protein [Patescibacteria group bacterium]
LLLTPFLASANIVINEVLYDPDLTDTGNEYIILYNNGDSDFDLTNYELNAVSGDYFVFPSFSLNAKSFVTIHWRTEGTNTQTDLYTGLSGFDANMGNTRGWVALFKSNEHTKNTIVDYLEYGESGQTYESKAIDAGIWTTNDFIPDVNAGKTIKLIIDGLDNNLSSDWIEANPTLKSGSEESDSDNEKTSLPETSITTNNYTPIANAGNNIIGFVGQEIFFTGLGSNDPNGFELSYFWNMGNGKTIEEDEFTYVFNYPGTYLVTLMVYNSRQYAWDTISVEIQTQEIYINEFLPNKWIEIYNNSNSIIDISNWQLDNNANNPFIFPTNTFIAPKSYLIFENEITGIEFNNKDSVKLLLPQEVVFQEINYEYLENELSCSRINNEFIWTSPTPGMANILELIGGKDREITYQYEVKQQQVKQQEQITEYIPVQEFQEPIFSNPLTKQLAMVPSLDKIDKEIENNPINENLKLILIIIIVILSASLIGIFITRFIKT